MSTRPHIIQGGMGVAVSDWRLARAVAQRGQLGVVSGVALEVVLTRRLQEGDPDGSMRRGLAAFAEQVDPQTTAWILDAYFIPGGLPAQAPYKPVPKFTLAPSMMLQRLTVAAHFVEVYLAKTGHDGLVGVNYLRKIELPIPAALYGALLAGADAVLVGAGSPHEIPALVRSLAAHHDGGLDIKVFGLRDDSGRDRVTFSPAGAFAGAGTASAAGPALRTPLPHPRVLAIVASNDLAAGLAGDPRTRPDGFIVEGPQAGGHNAPPRGPRRVDEVGQPVYDERDVVDLPALLELGLPVWLAGGQASPDAFRAAVAAGAAGIQVGTAFAFCDESGFEPGLKERVRCAVRDGGLEVRADWRCSPTGFPFQVAQLPGTLGDPSVVAHRRPVCDLAVLRSTYLDESGKVGYRCPAEPDGAFQRKGGRAANTAGRLCLCNALFAAAGHAQRRPGGEIEPAVVTSGRDLRPVAALMAAAGRADGGYGAADVVDYLLAPA